VWQLIRFHLLQAVNLNDHPELVRLLQPNESLSALLNLPAESTLIRWFNYHLQKAGVERTIKNFSKDVQDSELYIRLLNEIAPPQLKDEIQILMAKAESLSPDSEQNRLARATLVLEAAGLLGARKFATAKDIVSGNAKLNLGLTATIFNREIGINLPSEEDIRKLKNQIQSQREDITELQKVIETKDNTITQLGLMMRGKDERILDLNERMREATLNRLEEKDALEKQVTETKKQVAEGNGELASYKKKIAVSGRAKEVRCNKLVNLVFFPGRLRRSSGRHQGTQPRGRYGRRRRDPQVRRRCLVDASGTKGPKSRDRASQDQDRTGHGNQQRYRR
jgi:hypothetical protein